MKPNRKREKQHLNELERKLMANELKLYEAALELDRKRKSTYIQ